MHPDSLTQCDKESIHLISETQDYGAIVVVSQSDLKIRHLSKNFSQFFEFNEVTEELIGKRLNEVMGFELVESIHQQLPMVKIKGHVFFEYEGLDLYLFKMQNDLIGIEFSWVNDGSDLTSNSLNEYISSLKSAGDVKELCHIACKAVRQISGMDRVMMYRFFPPAMYGEVIAEDRNSHAQSFLYHRFPATDIPKPARDLYLRNKVRLIYDSESSTSEIYPSLDSNRRPLDFSDSRLRAVSKVHIEYLKNMQVRASFSIAVIVDDQLWGLIACHADKPLYVSHHARMLCQTIAETLAFCAPLLEKFQQKNRENDFQNKIFKLVYDLKTAADPKFSLFTEAEGFNHLFGSSGFALVRGQQVESYGLTPSVNQILELSEWLKQKSTTQSVFLTHSLSEQDPKWEAIKGFASGLAAVKLSEGEDAVLMLFRPETLYTISWGGDPRKNFEERNYAGLINPRASFETWTEVISKTSNAWEEFHKQGLVVFKNIIFDLLIRPSEFKRS